MPAPDAALPIDLIGEGIPLGTHGGREWVEICSSRFVAKCAETRARRRVLDGPLPPD